MNLDVSSSSLHQALTLVSWYCSAPKHPSFSRSHGSKGLTDEADVEFMKRESSLGTMTWEAAEPGTFLIRGKHYLRDNKKVILVGNDCLNFLAAVSAQIDVCSAFFFYHTTLKKKFLVF